MFFDLELLCRQGKGRFIAPWLAATRGISRLPKKEIEVVNIVKLCNELQKLILSESNKAKQRISLSLSAKLVHGLALLHNKQASMLLDDTVNFLHGMEHPILEKHVQRKTKAHGDFLPAISMIIQNVYNIVSVLVTDVKDKPKKTKIILSAEIVPEDQHVFTVEEIATALAEVPRASVDSITMREEVLAVVPRDETGFGDLGGIEAELHVQKNGHTLSKSSSRFQTIVEEVIEAQHIEPPTEFELLDGEPAPKRPRLSLTEPLQPTPVKAPAATVDEAQGPPTSLVVQPDQAETPRVIRRKKSKTDEKYYIHEETATKTNWKSKEYDETIEINKVIFTSNDTNLIGLRDVECSSLKKDVTIGDPDSARMSLRLSFMRSLRESRSSTPTLEEQEITPVIIKHAVTSAEIRPSSMDIILETSQEAPTQIMQPPPIASTPKHEGKRIPSVVVEKTLEPVEEQAALYEVEQTLMPAEERAIVSPSGSTQRRKTAKERQFAIIHIIQKWNFEERDLTIEYLCDSSRTWQKFAVIFEDLLYMSKHKYVKLIRHSSSIELKCIEKAPRLE